MLQLTTLNERLDMTAQLLQPTIPHVPIQDVKDAARSFYMKVCWILLKEYFKFLFLLQFIYHFMTSSWQWTSMSPEHPTKGKPY